MKISNIYKSLENIIHLHPYLLPAPLYHYEENLIYYLNELTLMF